MMITFRIDICISADIAVMDRIVVLLIGVDLETQHLVLDQIP